jgi:uncharacterized membrane protein YdbT with pleckstrin-like domain
MAMPESSSQPVNEEKYQKLGGKTLWLFILDKSQAAFAILLLSFILFFVGKQFGSVPFFNIFKFGILTEVALLGFALFGVVFLGSMFVGWLVYVNYKFCVGENALKIKRGIFTKEEVAIPYRQIQDVTIERDLSYQLLGLSKVVILNAGREDSKEGEADAEGILPALDKDMAEKMRDDLLTRANVEKVQDVQK